MNGGLGDPRIAVPLRTLHRVPACAGTTGSSAVALADSHRSTTVGSSESPSRPPPLVIPAKAGIQSRRVLPHRPLHWVPACAGTTGSSAGAFSGVNRNHKRREQQTPPQAPPVRHSGAGRNPEPTRAAAPPARTGSPRPTPHPMLHWVPACAGTTGSGAAALGRARFQRGVGNPIAFSKTQSAFHCGAGWTQKNVAARLRDSVP